MQGSTMVLRKHVISHITGLPNRPTALPPLLLPVCLTAPLTDIFELDVGVSSLKGQGAAAAKERERAQTDFEGW